jgi:plasmid stability protein
VELAFCCYADYSATMPVAITIRNVPEETRDELAARAAASGRSLQEYLREELIRLAERERPDPAVLVARVRERKRAMGGRLSAASILTYRDLDRRR